MLANRKRSAKFTGTGHRASRVLLDLGWVDFDFGVTPSCPVAQPLLPNSNQPRQNGQRALAEYPEVACVKSQAVCPCTVCLQFFLGTSFEFADLAPHGADSGTLKIQEKLNLVYQHMGHPVHMRKARPN